MKKNQTKLLALIALVLLIVFVIYQRQVSRISKNSEPVLFEVNGDVNGLNQAIHKLQDENLIHSAFFTKVQARMNGFNKVYAGTYKISQSMSSYEILDLFNDPQAANHEVIVQLTEGYWARDMANKISEATGVSSDDYIKLWNNKEFVTKMIEKYDFIPKEVINQKEAKVLLEGYLYPDTYSVNTMDTLEEVTEIILANGQDKYDRVKDKISKSKLSPHEIYTLASIVEYEASGLEDMKKVAGVFMNRLEIGMPLQSSVTICYTLYDFEDWTDCESAAGNQTDSPYNTYIYKGLPPGPILNPSLKSIEATLDYDKNDYFFFIADVYDVLDGEVHYQKTYEEHELVRMKLLGY